MSLFACSCPLFPTQFLRRKFSLHFLLMACYVEYYLTIHLGLFRGLCIFFAGGADYVSVFNASIRCSDYSGLVIQFDIRHHDHSLFFLNIAVAHWSHLCFCIHL